MWKRAFSFRLQLTLLVIATVAITCSHGHPTDLQKKDLQWDYMVFSQEWPPTFCLTKKCHLGPNVTDFNIHGLWPTINPDKQISNCEGAPKFNMTSLQSIRPELDNLWMDLLAPKEPNHFWKHEWTKHGTCAFEDELIKAEVDFFAIGILLKKRFNVLSRLQKIGLVPSNDTDYATVTMQMLAKSVFGVTVDFRCDSHRGGQRLLKEVRLCVDPKLNPIDCPYEMVRHLSNDDDDEQKSGDHRQNVVAEYDNFYLVYPPKQGNGKIDLLELANRDAELFAKRFHKLGMTMTKYTEVAPAHESCGTVFRFPAF